MKQELQDQLVGILSSISNTVGQAKDFALAQLPDIAQSYVLYGRISLTLYVVLSLVVLAASIYGVKPIVKAVEEDNPALGIPLIIGCLVGGVVGIFTFFLTLSPALLVWFAPKVWLLKEIASLIK